MTPPTENKSVLQAQTARAKVRQKKLAIALAIVMGIGVVGVYLPMRQSIQQRREQLARTNAELQSNEDRASTLPKLIAGVNSLRRQVEQYKPLRGRSDIVRAMSDISSINTSTHLQFYKYDNEQEKKHPTCLEQPWKITFQADFVDAMSFLQKLESMDRLTRVRSLSVKRKDGGENGEVQVSIALSLFFSPNE
jgi:Tfp pilus assembly protein PilO